MRKSTYFKKMNSFGKGILDDDKDFLKLLVLCGKEDKIMRDSQDEVFNEKYSSLSKQ